MKIAAIAIGLLGAVSAGNVMAEVYRCETDGKTLYTDRRCKNAETIDIETIDPKKAAEATKWLDQVREERAEQRKKEEEEAQSFEEESRIEELRLQQEEESQQQADQLLRDMRLPGRIYRYDLP